MLLNFLNMQSFSRLSYFFQNSIKFKPILRQWNLSVYSRPEPFRRTFAAISFKRFAIRKAHQVTPESLRVEFEDSLATDFYYVWLRDNCQCEFCVHPETKQKKLDIVSINLNAVPRYCNITDKGILKILWSEDKGEHYSYYDPLWLYNYGLGFERKQYKAVHNLLPPVKYWNKKYLTENLPEVDYKEVMESAQGLNIFLENFHKLGLIILRNAPCEVGQVVKVIDRISHVKNSNCGFFHIATKDTSGNLDYLPNALKESDFHTDLNYLKITPGVQVIHCLDKKLENNSKDLRQDKNTGKYFFVDGFRVAEWLKNNNLEHFKTLVSVPIKFQSISQNMYYINYQPLLKQNKSGDIIGVHFNNKMMAPLEGPSNSILSFYAALKSFLENLRKPDNYFSIALTPGDIIVFNNKRILHKRNGINSDLLSLHLEGCFADIDEIEARYRSSLSMKEIRDEE